jgi:hypothetical protein
MNAIACAEVADQLDLLAAGECEEPIRQAAERHLESCPACAASYAESRRLLVALDLQWSNAAQQRLRQRLREEMTPARPKKMVLPLVHRAAAIAALVLLTISLSWMLERDLGLPSQSSLQLVLLAGGNGKLESKLADAAAIRMKGAMAREKAKTLAESTITIPAPEKAGADFRQELLLAKGEGQLPPPTALPLVLALQNGGKRTLTVQLGGEAAELTLEIDGKGVMRLPAIGAAEPDILRPRTVQLQPGEKFSLQLDRLVEGSRGHLEYVYLTEPGNYTLTARCRVIIDGAPAYVSSGFLFVKVGP